MTMQRSVAVRDAMNNAFEAAVGVSAVLKLRTGAQPANCAAADAGTVVATLSLPSDWLGASSAGVIAKAGTWQDASADAGGTVAHYRIYATDGVTCHEQGSVTLTAGGGDMTLDAVVITAGQVVTISAYGLTMGNA